MSTGAEGSFAAFVELRCLCGRLHTLMRAEVLEGLTVSRWKCAGCRRRFVVACTPGDDRNPESFWPLYLENIPISGATRQEGMSADSPAASIVPEQLHFQCHCGCRLVGKVHMYGRPTRCPKCAIQIVVNVGYASEDGSPVPLLEYPEGGPPRPPA
jgi:hypothetical protein